MLPGHADAAVQLDALLRGVHRDRRAQRLRDARRQRTRVVGRVAGGGPCQHEVLPDVGEPVLESLERADRAAELVALLEVGDGGVETPLGEAELLGREQPRGRPQCTVHGGLGGVRTGEQRAGRAVERHVDDRAGQVERDHRCHRDTLLCNGNSMQLRAVRPGGRHEEDVRDEAVRDRPDPSRAARRRPRGPRPGSRRRARWRGRRRARRPCHRRRGRRAAPAPRSPALQPSSAVVASTALPRNGTGATNRPSSSITTAVSRIDAPCPPSSSGTCSDAAPSPVSSRHSARSYGSSVSQRARTDVGCRAVGQQVLDAGAELVLDVRVQEVHRGRSSCAVGDPARPARFGCRRVISVGPSRRPSCRCVVRPAVRARARR